MTHFTAKHGDGEIIAYCRWENTRTGFRHLCEIVGALGCYDGKAVYYNRTWEKYEYQTVLSITLDKAVKDKTITADEKAKIMEQFDPYAKKTGVAL